MAGGDLRDAPHARIHGRHEPDLGDARTVRGEEQRDESPGEPVVEVVDEARLRARAKRGHAVRGLRERGAQSRWRGGGAGVLVCLLKRDVRGGVADEQHRQQEGDHGDHGAGDHEDIAGGELCGEQAADPGGERDAAVAGGLIEAECKSAAARADEVDLHDDRHGPGKALIDAEQRVGGNDPTPARRDADQQRDGQRGGPPRDQQASASRPLRERSGRQIGECLDEPERDDERQDGSTRRQVEVVTADQRKRRALEADHRADERVDGDQERELCGVLAQPESHRYPVHPTSVTDRPLRLAATIAACCSGAGGMSQIIASTNASSESNCRARLWTRSKPIVETGLADRPRPQTDPE